MQDQALETSVNAVTLASALESVDFLENATPTISITSEYLEFKVEGENNRLIFLGFTKINVKNNDELKEIDAVQFMGKGKKMFVNGSVNLVNQIKNANLSAGQMLSITFTGKDKNVKLFDIQLLEKGAPSVEANVVLEKTSKK